ncbi:MAG: ribosome-associated translation inhibitor RaiA [Bdellovibrionota bacterium]
MIINMSFKQLEPTEAIKAHATEKSEKLKKYFDGKIHVTWNFAVEKQSQIAHCHLVGNHMDFFGEAATEDLYASIELAVSKLEKQLKKHKEIVTRHHPRHQHQELPTSPADDEAVE